MTAQTRDVDVAIIGAGTAGLGAWREVRRSGCSVVMIDPGPFGTTCARVGCMPSKLVIAAADVADHIAHGARFGVHAEGVRVDGAAVMRRVQAERDRFVGFVLQPIAEARAAGELLEGRAQISARGQIQVEGGPQVNYRRLVIANGTTPVTPPPFRGLGQALLTNESVFELKTLPESLLVIGLGVIGLELGQAFQRLGVRTTLLGMGGLVGPLTDPEVLQEARRCFQETLDLHPDYKLEQVEPEGEGVRIRFVDSKGEQRSEFYERVLMAAGRRAQLEELGLAKLGLSHDGRGRYPINPATLQLGDEPIFVAGDANNLHPLLHEASDDGHIAGANAARFPEVTAPQRRTSLGVVFSDPQVAMVGQSYQALADCSAVAGSVDYGDQGRARVAGKNRGKVRVYADRVTGQLLGAEMCGPQVEHTAHLLAWAVQQGLTAEQALGMPFYHPVVEEGIRTALRELNANLERGERIKCRVTELGVGS